MRIWGKKAEVTGGTASVAAVALAGSSHEGLVREALRALTQAPCPDRVGIWLEPDVNAQPGELSGAYHGFVRDHAAKEESPPEWKILSLEPLLPEQLLLRPEPFEQDLGESDRSAVIGQLVGLRRAFWVPVADQGSTQGSGQGSDQGANQGQGFSGRVRGLILLGSVVDSLAPFLDRAKSVAAELALALRAEEQFRAVRIRNADLDLVRHIVESGSDRSSLGRLLAHLVDECVRDFSKGEGLGASFAAIGITDSLDGCFSPATQPDFRWRSGDDAWTSSMSRDPLAKLWRRALETREMVGSDAPVTRAQASVARVVVLPLETDGQLLGVMVAGFPADSASLATLGRLELRARLAAFVLLRGRRLEE